MNPTVGGVLRVGEGWGVEERVTEDCPAVLPLRCVHRLQNVAGVKRRTTLFGAMSENNDGYY